MSVPNFSKCLGGFAFELQNHHPICYAGLALLGLHLSGSAAQYQLESLSVQPPATPLRGGAYSAEVTPSLDVNLQAGAGSYSLTAIAPGLYEAHSPSLPTLTLRLGTGGTMTITWSDAANQFDLEETDQLSTPIGWKTVANKSQQGDQWTVTWEPSDASQTHFFRLKSR